MYDLHFNKTDEPKLGDLLLTSNLKVTYGGRGLVARCRMTRRFHTPSSMTAIP